MPAEHVLTPDDKCPCGKPQTGSGYCSYECYSKHEPEPASMGGPLSEAERARRLAEIAARLANASGSPAPWYSHFETAGVEITEPVHEILDAGGGRVCVTDTGSCLADLLEHAPADIEFLLRLVGVLEGQLATARAELEQQRYYGEQLQMSIESCSGNHDDALGLDGGDPDER